MVDTFRPMSHLEARNTRTVIAPKQSNIGHVRFSRVGTIGLVALITAALWAAIIYLGGWLIGIHIPVGVLLWILGAIFLVALFGLALVSSAGRNRGEDNGNPLPGSGSSPTASSQDEALRSAD